MGYYPIVTSGHPALRQTCEDVDLTDPNIPAIAATLREAQVESRGVGIAANQIGMLLRMCYVGETLLINPKIMAMTVETETTKEGCLSLPGEQHEVERPLAVAIEALDLQGNVVQFEADGFEAKIVCHEIAHLNGELISDVGHK